MTPLHVSPKDLEDWAQRNDARGGLPRLVRLLIHATSRGLRHCDFPSNEGIASRGFDGILETDESTAWVPSGRSVWELSVQEGPKGKADKDYYERTQAPAPPSQLATTYVAVTLRCWSGRRAWAESRRGEGAWRDVRALDANDLAGWLEQAPAVSAWFGRSRGIRLSGVSDMEEYWEEIANHGPVSIPPQLIRGGGSPTEMRLLEILRGSPSAHRLVAHTRQAAGLWFGAVAQALNEETKAEIVSRTLVVRDPESWRALVRADQKLVLIPDFDLPFMVGAAVRHGHHVLILRGERDGDTDDLRDFPALGLPTPGRDEITSALVSTGIPEPRAAEMARRMDASRAGLLDLVGHSAAPVEVVWPEPARASRLLGLTFLAQWDDESDGDRAVVARLCARSYDDVMDEVMVTLRDGRGPLERRGSVFRWRDRQDAWTQLSALVGRKEVERLQECSVHVLGTPDPSLELPNDERWMAAVQGKVLPWSAGLRAGLADALPLLATRGAQIQEGTDSKHRAAQIVGDLLGNATPERWASVADLLPTLAEAAPERFLDSVRHGLLASNAAVELLFAEEGQWGHSRHTGLLWALERLAWAPEYFSAACLALATLADRDPGGRLANRPLASLVEIFRGWHPQTLAPIQRRIDTLDAIHRHSPAAALKLVGSLLPESGGESASGTNRPQWQTWADAWLEPTNDAEWNAMCAAASERIVRWAGNDGKVWADLIGRIHRLSPSARTVALSILADVDPQSLENATSVWHALRKAVNSHRSYEAADWALPAGEVDVLLAAWNRLAPADAVERSLWLFDHHVELPVKEDDDYNAVQAAIASSRVAAVTEIYSQKALQGIMELTADVEVPYFVGSAVAQALTRDSTGSTFLEVALSAGGERERIAALGFAAERFQQAGWSWGDETLSLSWLTSSQVADILCAFPFESATWARVDSRGVSETYWQRVRASFVRDAPADGLRAIESLLAATRPYAALELSTSIVMRKEAETMVPSSVLVSLLQACLGRSPSDEPMSGASANLGWKLARLIGLLETRGDVDRSRLATLEWAWLPALRFEKDATRTLQEVVTEEPNLFAEILSFVYKDERQNTDESPAPDEKRQAIATQGWQLLQLLARLPGRKGDTVDPAALEGWVGGVLERATALGRATIAEHEVGKLLGRTSPVGADGAWPHEAVRDVIERRDTERFTAGFTMGPESRMRARAVDSKNPGGADRASAARYREWADRVDGRWPVTAGALRRLADSFDAMGAHFDRNFGA